MDRTNPDCNFVRKVPSIHPQDHPGYIMKAINKCWRQVSTYIQRELSAHFDRILSGISCVNPKVRKALRSYILQGEISHANDDNTDQ